MQLTLESDGFVLCRSLSKEQTAKVLRIVLENDFSDAVLTEWVQSIQKLGRVEEAVTKVLEPKVGMEPGNLCPQYTCVGVKGREDEEEYETNKIKASKAIRIFLGFDQRNARDLVDGMSTRLPWTFYWQANRKLFLSEEDKDILQEGWKVLVWEGEVPPLPRVNLIYTCVGVSPGRREHAITILQILFKENPGFAEGLVDDISKEHPWVFTPSNIKCSDNPDLIHDQEFLEDHWKLAFLWNCRHPACPQVFAEEM